MTTKSDPFAKSREYADRCAAGGPGSRSPSNFQPGNPTQDHRVCFELGCVLRAAKYAVKLGATRGELEMVIDDALRGGG